MQFLRRLDTLGFYRGVANATSQTGRGRTVWDTIKDDHSGDIYGNILGGILLLVPRQKVRLPRVSGGKLEQTVFASDDFEYA